LDSRLALIRSGLTRLFVANNRQISAKLIEDKALLLLDSLDGLATNRIDAFFKYLRENEDTLPSDGKMLSILRSSLQRFGTGAELVQIEPVDTFGARERETVIAYGRKYPEYESLFSELLEDDSPYPSGDWKRRFFKQMKIDAAGVR